MRTNEQLLIDYAVNRTELRRIQAEIFKLNYGEAPCWDGGHLAEIEKHFKAARADYYDVANDGDEGESGWPGWGVVLAETGSGYPDCVYKSGELHDLRRTIIREAGRTRTAIAQRGRQLLRSAA